MSWRGNTDRYQPPYDDDRREQPPPRWDRDDRYRAPPPYDDRREPSRGWDDRAPPAHYGDHYRAPPPRDDHYRAPPPRDDHYRAPPPRDDRRREPSPRRYGNEPYGDDRWYGDGRPYGDDRRGPRDELNGRRGAGPVQRRPDPRAGPYDRPREGQAGQKSKMRKYYEGAKPIDAPLLTAHLKKASSVDELLRLVDAHGDGFNSIHCSAAWSYLGKQGWAACKKPNHWAGICRLLRLAAAQIPRAKARELATIVFGVAKARVTGVESRELVEAVAAAATPRMREFNPQDLANTVWAYATGRWLAPALFDALAAAAAPRLREFKCQDFANTVWAFSKAGHSAPALFDAVAAAAPSRLHEFDTQALANTVWSFAKAEHSAPALFDAIAAEMIPRLPKFEPQNLASCTRDNIVCLGTPLFLEAHVTLPVGEVGEIMSLPALPALPTGYTVAASQPGLSPLIAEEGDEMLLVTTVYGGNGDDEEELAGVETKRSKPKSKAELQAQLAERDPYKLLELDAVRWRASTDDVKKAYRRMVLKHHPDKQHGAANAVHGGGGDDDEDGKGDEGEADGEGDEMFKAVTEAFELLSDPKRRRDFDSLDEFDDSIPKASWATPLDMEGFLREFGPIFERNSRWSELPNAPLLGEEGTLFDEVADFYNFWCGRRAHSLLSGWVGASGGFGWRCALADYN